MNDHDDPDTLGDDGFEDVMASDDDPAVDEYQLSTRAGDGSNAD